MSQCLRCSKPCETSAVFCDECRSLLRDEYRQGSVSRSSDPEIAVSPARERFSAPPLASSPTSVSTPSLVAQKPGASDEDPVDDDATPPRVAKTSRSPGAPITPHPPTLNNYISTDISEQAMSRLSEAAQLISEAEPSNRRLPRASRLAPMRDISADIRRESTPLPKFSRRRASTDDSEKVSDSGPLPAAREHEPERELRRDGELPDLWPWLDSEVEERENEEDTWANSTDPLISRHIPTSIEAARIEEEDIKRALAEGVPTSHDLRTIRSGRAFSLRTIFAVLALLAACALIVDGVLFSVVVSHPRHAATIPGGPAVPALTLSPNVATVSIKNKQVAVPVVVPVRVQIMNFPAGQVQLTHDVQEAVKTTSGSSMVTVGKNGSASVTLLVDDNWSVGFDQVYAENVKTHYTAGAQLQIIGSAPSKPAHLELLDQNGKDITSLDFGTDYQGSNSILPLTLMNSGSGSITWSASSDQSWLLVSPAQGTFSQSQQIEVAAQRMNLKPGKHTGVLTFSSNVSIQPQTVQVTVTVSPLISGSLLSPGPAVLSFTTTDGSQDPRPLSLTLNNPGTKPLLSWSLTITASDTTSNQVAVAQMPASGSSWLSATPDEGSILAGSSQQIVVSVNSINLLPGAYQGALVFSAPGALDLTQVVPVSLTVQPHCGLVTNSGSLSFTAVYGKTNPSNQSLGLNATASCAGAPIPWKAALSSSAGWLSATPTSGILKGTTSEFISIGANAAGLPPRPYYGFIALTTLLSTQTVMISLTVQSPPAKNAPVMSAAPLNLNFSNTQGQASPQGQVVTIINSGGSTLNWRTNSNQIVTSSWLNAHPSYGSVSRGSTGQLVVSVNTAGLSPGTYAGQVLIFGADASGKPASGSGQVVSINLVVQPPCTLTQPSSSSLAFSGVQGGTNPGASTLLITGTGNCSWPLTLSLSVPSAPWLSANPVGNKINANGQSVSIVVSANMSGLQSGPPLSAGFTISATDSAGIVATGSPQTVSASLTVLPPCLPVVGASSLTFNAAQGQSTGLQNVQLSESGTCSRPVTWRATGDAGSSAWLSLPGSLQDTGSGASLGVSVNSASLAAGTYTGTISLTATDNNNNPVVGTPKYITVTLNVTATVSGTVVACQPGPAPLCTTPASLPGAVLMLYDNNKLVETTTADGSGNYTFTNLLPGNYTVNVTGTDASNVHYSTSGIPFPVNGNASGVSLDVYPG